MTEKDIFDEAEKVTRKAIQLNPDLALAHANLAGEHITGLEGHPPLNINEIKETFKHDISEILKETLEHERKAIKTYYDFYYNDAYHNNR